MSSKSTKQSSNKLLRQWRKTKKISIEQLAQDIGKKPATIRAYESSRGVLPQLGDLIVWFEKYDLDIHWLVTGLGDMDYSYREVSENKYQDMQNDINDLKNRLDFWIRRFETESQNNESEL